MTNYTIGMWMYRNGGGEVIQQRIIEQLNQNGIAVINNLSLKNGYANNGHIFSGKVEMANLDLYFSYNASEQSDYQVYLYQALNMTVPCINSFEAFCVSEDKFKTSHLLNQNGVPTANYQLCHHQELERAREILRNWGGKALFKPTNGWGGKGIIKIESAADFERLLPLLNETKPGYFYLERWIDNDFTDFRVDVVDGTIVGCYGRKAAQGDWRTNISCGGSIILREINDQIAYLSLRAARLTGLDIAGVDLIYDREREQFVVLEVNGIPAFATPEQEKFGLDFNALKIEKIVNLIERKVKLNSIGNIHEQALAKHIA